MQIFENQHNLTLWMTGITSDRNIDEGIKHLLKTAPYTEVSVGGAFFNLGFNQYIWNDFEGPAITPQLIVLQTNMDLTPAGNAIASIVRKERLLNRYIGVDEINEFHKMLDEETAINAGVKLGL